MGNSIEKHLTEVGQDRERLLLKKINNLERYMVHLNTEVKGHYIRWVLLLTQEEEIGIEDIIKVYQSTKSWGSAIMTYRKELRKNGRGEVSDKDIIEAYNREDLQKLKDLLSEKCLEGLTDRDVALFLNNLHSRGWSIDKALKKLNRKPNARLLSIVL